MRVSGITRYLTKSCAGRPVESARIGRRGIEFDHLWMVVEGQGNFLSQRDRGMEQLCRVDCALSPAYLVLLDTMNKMAPCSIDRDFQGLEIPITLRGYQGSAIDMGDEAAKWFYVFLGKRVRLVRMPETEIRMATQGNAQQAYHDGYPFLITSKTSLAWLNERSSQPVPMDRFRPTIEIEGCEAFAEDTWKRIRIGDVEFECQTLCKRCSIPSINQRTGARGREPNATLWQYRELVKGDVFFGRNANHLDCGEIRVGQEVEVLE